MITDRADRSSGVLFVKASDILLSRAGREEIEKAPNAAVALKMTVERRSRVPFLAT